MEIGARTIGVILRILDFILTPLFWLAGRGKDGTVPAVDNPILLHSATELAKKIRKGELQSEDVVSSYIARIKSVNVYLNAVVEERYRDAIDEAKEVDKLLKEIRRDDRWTEIEDRPLLGVPFTVKESCSLIGMSDSVGCLDNAGRRATSDGEAVSRMKKAGGIPLLVSNTPELCLGWETSNLLNGTTNNPYSLNRTPGGSSGGEAALLASAASPLSIGSDIAGSIRLPAAFCGVFGHKPTPGIIPIGGHIPTLSDPLFPKFLTVGPMSRYSEDLVTATKIMAGPEVSQALKLDDPVDFKQMKVFYMTEADYSIAIQDVPSCIKTAIVNAAEYMKECGAKVEKGNFKELGDSVEISVSVFFTMKDIPNMLQDPSNPKRDKSAVIELAKHALGGGTRSIQGLGFTFLHKSHLFITESRREYYQRQAKIFGDKLKEILGDNGVLLYPVTNCLPFQHNEVYVKCAGILYSMLFNVLGMPATSVPMGLYKGLPVSLQVIAAPNQDRLCLAVAKKLEEQFGGWRPPVYKM